MRSRVAGVALVGAIVIVLGGVSRGVTLAACGDRPFDPLCVSLVFPTQSPPTVPLLTAGPSSATPLGPTAAIPEPTTPVEYTFDDEFDGPTLGSAWGNYWGTAKPGRWSGSQAKVLDGVLTLTAEDTGSGWEGALVDVFRTFKQQYGYFSARVNVPQGRGVWAAFWLAEDWARSGTEVDVMEVCANVPGTHDGNDATLVHHIVHDAKGDHAASFGERLTDLTGNWHVFGLDWRPEAMIFYRDGIEIWRIDDASKIPAVPMTVILSLTTGNWCGKPDATTPNPSVMRVDWVRVTR